jgi:23S rRNA (guanine745-N1)-methyltransferase
VPRRATIGYRCPVCALDLVEEPTGFVCANGHRYDRAKEGYVNLLPGGRLKGRPAGDDEAMVRARRTVFDAGLYDPVMDAVAGAVERATRACRDGAPRVLDCGSGEGSYLAAVARRAPIDAWGIDVSKPAVRAAARRHPDQHHAVASAYQLPFAADTFDVVMSVFSPRPRAEMMRVLHDGGVAVLARPGPEHLAELKALVYTDARRHRDPAAADDEWTEPPRETAAVQFVLDLSDPVLRMGLLEMTPYWWSTRAERRDSIAATSLTVQVDIRITVFDHAA